MRKSANSDDDDVMKFISYSNADVKLAKESAKRSQGDSSEVPSQSAQSWTRASAGCNMDQAAATYPTS